ncbi:lysine transporter LysE [Hyphomicrobium methylovorum]|uniref:LysE family translocator n=1 Tax=Hyphomicrobium methylovorum TaxID=84 RepID=UPI0015E73D1E|nr:LysE family transporter [Hyphomicrobium methylovorum]MBA2127285.1 lysine transporter LysE [Hyphomicrobium methylovorum]
MDFIPNPLIIPIGLIVGVLIAAPVGPVNVLCIQRAIERGFWGGVAAGIGSVMGDGLIALCAGLGVGSVSGAVENHRAIIQICGGLALMGFGARLYFSAPRLRIATEEEASTARLRDFVWDIPQTFFLTITNPGAVLGLFAVFGGISTFVEVHSTVDVFLMVAAIVCGSLIWWVTLSNIIGRYRHQIRPDLLQFVNRIAGILLAVFGAVLIAEVIYKAGNF